MDEQTTYLAFYLRSDTARVYVGALRGIGEPKIIRFLINPDTMEMIMQPYHRKEFQSFRVPKGVYEPDHGIYRSMQVHSKEFCRLVAGQLGWTDQVSYRVPGKIYRERKMVLFELRKAEII